ncbi:MAG: hypothetical protein WCJ30_24115, partial [Deltaproteobacteria bacterium]
MPDLTSVDGSMPTQVFHLVATHRDGTMAPFNSGVWSLASTRLGTLVGGTSMPDQATFTANGIVGGTLEIRADGTGAGGAPLHATATLHVLLTRTLVVAGAPADSSLQFASATPDPTGARANLLYPLDHAVMPNNVTPPDVQWEAGAAGDLYRIQIQKPDLTITAYVSHSGAGFRFDWPVDAAAWRTVAESDPGAEATIQVDLLHAATSRLVVGTPIHVTLTEQGVFGAVYYWAINEGRLLRIDPDTGMRENFMPNPPSGCVACHTISRDGRYLAGSVDGSPRSLALFDLTRDLTAAPAPTVFNATLTYVFSTFSPDGSRLLATGYGGDDGSGSDGFILLDAATGASVPADNLPASHRVTHADWSPDGQHVVYIGNVSGAAGPGPYPSHFTNGDVTLMSVSGTARLAFGTPTVLTQGTDLSTDMPPGAADAHPVWSPDSRVIAFQHGPVCYSQFNTLGALYVIRSTTGSRPVRLDQANGGPTGTSAFWPTFAPYETNDGGTNHYWIAFFSQRDYGNAQAGTRGAGRRQLWVTAVRAGGAAGDPSSVPYWLPGQDIASENAAAQWAASPCRANASDCTVSSECCSGRCLPDP